MPQKSVLRAFSQAFLTMISNLHFKILDTANRELAHRFEKIRKARARHDTPGIKHAEMEYYQALQHLYTAVQDAVAGQSRLKP